MLKNTALEMKQLLTILNENQIDTDLAHTLIASIKDANLYQGLFTYHLDRLDDALNQNNLENVSLYKDGLAQLVNNFANENTILVSDFKITGTQLKKAISFYQEEEAIDKLSHLLQGLGARLIDIQVTNKLFTLSFMVDNSKDLSRIFRAFALSDYQVFAQVKPFIQTSQGRAIKTHAEWLTKQFYENIFGEA